MVSGYGYEAGVRVRGRGVGTRPGCVARGRPAQPRPR